MQKGNVLIFLLVGIVVLAAIGGAFYIGKQAAAPKLQPQTTQTTPSSAPTASPAPNGVDETANWKMYNRNLPSGSIKYPPNFYLAPPEGTGGIDYIFDSVTTFNQYKSSGVQSLNENQILISVGTLAEKFDNMQTLANRIAGGTQQNVPYTTEDIAGAKAVKVIYQNIENYGIPTNDGFVWISAQPSTSNLISVFQTIIVTFKFTN